MRTRYETNTKNNPDLVFVLKIINYLCAFQNSHNNLLIIKIGALQLRTYEFNLTEEIPSIVT